MVIYANYTSPILVLLVAIDVGTDGEIVLPETILSMKNYASMTF